jgi:hypothetical protein
VFLADAVECKWLYGDVYGTQPAGRYIQVAYQDRSAYSCEALLSQGKIKFWTVFKVKLHSGM